MANRCLIFGSKGFVGITSCLSLINVYEIYFEDGMFACHLLESFRVSSLGGRIRFITAWFKIICWIGAVTGPNQSFHLPYNVRTKTTNGHHVTWKGDVILKEFKTIDPMRSVNIQTAYAHHLTNVEWGDVLDGNKAISINRIGRKLQECLREGKVSKRQVVNEVAAGLSQLHELNLAHTDISVANVLVDSTSATVFIADLEYLRPLEGPPRDGLDIASRSSTLPTTAAEQDEAQFNAFKIQLEIL